MKNRYVQKGVSLLEVIIAFAITSILVAATMPNFQDYAIRGRVIEAINQVEPAERALVNTCMNDETAIVDQNEDADYWHRPQPAEQDFVDRVVLAADCLEKDLTVMVWMINTGATPEPIIELSAMVPSGVTSEGFEEPYFWNCRVIRGDYAHVPTECRKRYRK